MAALTARSPQNFAALCSQVLQWPTATSQNPLSHFRVMLTHPATKYRSFAPIQFTQRTWPDRQLTHPPIWLSTDLRDGNQALAQPMSLDQKQRLFKLLVEIGFKEIEVGFPSASQTEFDFVRSLIDQNLIPDDVTIQVLTQSREHLIQRTFQALQGAKRAIVHVYNATAPHFRRIVFGKTQAETIELATAAAQLIKDLAAQQPGTDWRFQYSPEVFTATELDFAKSVCDAVLDIWQPPAGLDLADRKVIINLPASVEVSMPNVFADQVEWMHRNLKHRDRLVLSVHNHNDRGTATAAAELGQLAGADRVEGCLFGNGERTGNVDLVTLAMNLYTQGIHPGLDFSKLDAIAAVVKDCTQLPIHPRHPYVGELVHTAFSGSHQDAIKKGFAVQDPDGIWEVPYLPMDPADIGRSYEAVVRVNSQSGKGGMAFLLERDYGLALPRGLQIEFGQVVQQAMDAQHFQSSGREMSSADLWGLFEQHYLQPGVADEAAWQYCSHRLEPLGQQGDEQCIWTTLQYQGQVIERQGQGNGPIAAFVNALDLPIQVQAFEERSLTAGRGAEAIAYVQLREAATGKTCYGVGIHRNIVTASLLAVISGVNQLEQAATTLTV